MDTVDTEHVFQAHLAEYQALRNEINSRLGFQNQLPSYAILIIAGATSLFAFGAPNDSIAMQNPFLFLIASILMSAVTWTNIEQTLNITDLAVYIQYALTPKIQKLVANNDLPELLVMRWDWDRPSVNHPARYIPRSMMDLGKFAVSWVPGVIFIIVFYHLRLGLTISWSAYETVFFGVSIVAALLPPMVGLWDWGFYIRDATRSLHKEMRNHSIAINKPTETEKII